MYETILAIIGSVLFIGIIILSVIAGCNQGDWR